MEDENKYKDEAERSDANAEELSEIYERQSRRYSKSLDLRDEVK